MKKLVVLGVAFLMTFSFAVAQDQEAGQQKQEAKKL